MKINLYDFDETIYDGDSSVDFFKYCMKKHKSIYFNLPKMGGAALLYALHIWTKTRMKETIFSFVQKVDDIDKEVEEFWKTHKKNIKQFYNDKKHDKDIIISASPEFLLAPIAKELKVMDMMASPVDKKTGKFDGLNCHDVEKVRRLNEKYTDYEVEETYSDSLKSDEPILRLAKKPYIVKKNKLILHKFR
jgi:phosphoserine phosphatase